MIRFAVCCAIFLTILSPAWSATGVHVQADERGQGFLVRTQDGCHLVTPAHVIGDPVRVVATFPGGTRLSFLPAVRIQPDLSISSPDSTVTDCPQRQTSSLDKTLPDIQSLSIMLVSESGTVQNIGATLERYDHSTLTLRLSGRSPMQGMSGALVRRDGMMLGQVQSVNPSDGTVNALRMDYISDVTGRYFAAREAFLPNTSPQNLSQRRPPRLVSTTIDPALIVSGSSDSMLTENGGVTFLWQREPVTVIFSADQSGGTLFYRHLPHSSLLERPQSVEISVRGNSTSEWNDLGTAKLEDVSSRDQTLTTIPLGFSEVRLRFLFPKNGRQFSVGSLQIIPPSQQGLPK